MINRRKPPESRIERQIVTGMIVNDHFLKELIPIYRPGCLRLSFAQSIATWCMEYFKEYNCAPGKHIQDLFLTHKATDPDPDRVKLIEDFLSGLSSEYETAQNFNVEYILDKTENHFRQVALEGFQQQLSQSITGGRVEDGEALIAGFDRVTRPESIGVDPVSDSRVIAKAFDKDSGERMFAMQGDLGRMLGRFERGTFAIVVGPMGRGKCLHKNSKILLSNGKLKPLKQIKEDKDKNCVSINNNLKIVESNISKFHINGIKPIIEIITRTGRKIKITSNHPLFEFEKKWVSVDDGLQMGDHIAVPKSINIFGNKKLPSEHVRLIAYLLADGGLTGSEITFTKKEQKIKDDVIKIITNLGDQYREDNDLTISINKGRHNYSPKKTKTKKLLLNYGIKLCKSIHKTIPDCIFTLPQEQLKEFLKILFTCDGSVYNFGIEYSSGSEEMIRQVSHLLLRFGVIGKIETQIVKGIDHIYWSFSIRDSFYIRKFIENIGFAFSKKKKANEILKIAKQKKNRSAFDSLPMIYRKTLIKKIKASGIKHPAFESITEVPNAPYKVTKYLLSKINNILQDKDIDILLNSDVIFDEIISINNIGLEETYDITIPGYHNFISDDICAHNTWWLQEIALRGLFCGYNVLFVTLEMSYLQMTRRIQHNLTGLPKDKWAGEIIIPVFDCKKNQSGECKLANRIGNVKLLKNDGVAPNYENEPRGYKICTECRGQKEQRRFEPAVWYKTIQKEGITASRAIGKGQALARSLLRGGKFKLIDPPPGSLSISGLRTMLDNWEYYEGWVPDVIVTDYIEKFKSEDSYAKEGRDKINSITQAHKALARERNCLVASGSQSNTARDEKKRVKSGDFADDIRKKAEIDIGFSLNQFPEEKEKGIMIVSPMKIRDDYFSVLNECTVLEQLKIGRPYLDSYCGWGNTKM